jgi:hypothetical protein
MVHEGRAGRTRGAHIGLHRVQGMWQEGPVEVRGMIEEELGVGERRLGAEEPPTAVPVHRGGVVQRLLQQGGHGLHPGERFVEHIELHTAQRRLLGDHADAPLMPQHERVGEMVWKVEQRARALQHVVALGSQACDLAFGARMVVLLVQHMQLPLGVGEPEGIGAERALGGRRKPAHVQAGLLLQQPVDRLVQHADVPLLVPRERCTVEAQLVAQLHDQEAQEGEVAGIAQDRCGGAALAALCGIRVAGQDAAHDQGGPCGAVAQHGVHGLPQGMVHHAEPALVQDAAAIQLLGEPL